MGLYEIVSEGRVEKVALSMLYPSELNNYGEDNIEDLAGSIRSYGLITPLSVAKDADGKYEILSGNRRYKALTKLVEEGNTAYEEVGCIIFEDALSDLEKKLVIEAANLDVRDDFDRNSHRMNLLNIINEMVKSGDAKYNDVVKEASKFMHCSDRYIRMYNQILGSSDALQELVRNNEVSVVDASRISGFNEDTQKEILNRIDNGEKPKSVVTEFAKAEREKNSPKPSLADTMNSYNSFEDAFWANTSNDVDLNIDTTGMLKGYLQEDKDSSSDFSAKREKEYQIVSSLCNRLTKKTEFTEREIEVLEVMCELVDHYRAVKTEE